MKLIVLSIVAPVSIFINVRIMKGRPHETVSARAWINHWQRTERSLNFLMCWVESDHCKKSHDRYMVARFG